ncbi:MAG: 5-formyltetrahydrofolate cyclo-ligase [Gammaproteobacteria bacterium]|nr:5-formyltetrahydrofolate cyclo-ligase [Gammaproteobacteria bacterium]
MAMISKQTLRQKLLAQRKQVSAAQQRYASTAILQQLLTLDVFKTSQRLAAYLVHGQEVDPLNIMDYAWSVNKHCYVPRLQDTCLSFVHYQRSAPLRLNTYRIAEPLPPYDTLPVDKLDLIFLPLVGFDEQGHRLGRGKGYYDRTLAHVKQKPLLIGLAYEFQHIPSLSPDDWDVPLDFIITEKKTYSLD